MKTNSDMVGEFMRKFGLPTEGSMFRSRILDDKTFLFRYHLMEEELHEILKAHRQGDVVALADGIADLLYVTYGLAQHCGIPIDEVFEEVHEANMRKERSSGDGDPRSPRCDGLDVVKPIGWTPPDVAAIITRKEHG